jgi:hypothetical protein
MAKDTFSVYRAASDLRARKTSADTAVTSMQQRGSSGATPMLSARKRAIASSFAPNPIQGNTFGAPMGQSVTGIMTPEEIERHRKALESILKGIAPRTQR